MSKPAGDDYQPYQYELEEDGPLPRRLLDALDFRVNERAYASLLAASKIAAAYLAKAIADEELSGTVVPVTHALESLQSAISRAEGKEWLAADQLCRPKIGGSK